MENIIYIAGAHSRGQTFKEYVTFLYPDTVVAAYLVDDLTDNEPVTGGIEVKEIKSESDLNGDYPVYIATRGIYHEKLSRELKALGIKKIYPVDVAMDRKLRNAYVKKVYMDNNREFCTINEPMTKQSIHARIYVAASVSDPKLHKPYELAPEERVIQVGTALTDRRLEEAVVFDHTGDHISDKNRQYCELTALYWIWKNAQQEVVGLVHYRRHFLLPDNWLEWMYYNKVDVILPVPLYVAPSLEKNYKERHDPSDWIFMMDYLKNNCDSDYEKAKQFFQGNLYSPCNMFIMKKSILDDLCEWLFPILYAVEEHGGQKKDLYLNRYPGFISERLITYFFECQREKYKVAYADKNFLD